MCFCCSIFDLAQGWPCLRLVTTNAGKKFFAVNVFCPVHLLFVYRIKVNIVTMPKGFRWEACQATIQETGISKCNNFLVISFLDLERPKKGKIIAYFLISNKFFCQVTRWKVTIRPWKWRFQHCHQDQDHDHDHDQPFWYHHNPLPTPITTTKVGKEAEVSLTTFGGKSINESYVKILRSEDLTVTCNAVSLSI